LNFILNFGAPISVPATKNHKADCAYNGNESQNDNDFNREHKKANQSQNLADQRDYLFQKCDDKSQNRENASPTGGFVKK
jgi:hypothetical protein